MIVRARVKNLEDLSDDLKCCDDTIQAIINTFPTEESRIIEVYHITPRPCPPCPRCGHIYKASSEWMPTNGEFWALPTEAIDIDEGEIHANLG